MQEAKFVLDSFALLCLLQDEAGATDVKQLLDKGKNSQCQLIINVVNLAEVHYTIKRRDGDEIASEVLSLIESFPLTLENVDKTLALLAAEIKAKFSIALGDCFCAASAKKNSAKVVTGDPEFERLKGEVAIQWLPKKRTKNDQI